MKKIFNKILMVIICIFMVVVLTNEIFATDPIIIDTNEYDDAQQIGNLEVETGDNDLNNIQNNTDNNTSNNNTAKRYNNTGNTSVPQTGIEDYNIGILLIFAVASAIYAYKKIKDYNNI